MRPQRPSRQSSSGLAGKAPSVSPIAHSPTRRTCPWAGTRVLETTCPLASSHIFWRSSLESHGGASAATPLRRLLPRPSCWSWCSHVGGPGDFSLWACPLGRGAATSCRGPGGDDAGGRWGNWSGDGGRRARASSARASSPPRAAEVGGFSPVLRHGRWAYGDRKGQCYWGSPWGGMAGDPPDLCAPPAPDRALKKLKGVCFGGAAPLLVRSLRKVFPKCWLPLQCCSRRGTCGGMICTRN